MATPTPKETLDALFPIPTAPTVADGLKPVYSPGFSSESAKTLVKLLKENHEKFHIFFNDRGFHNHLTHHLYAIYTLGAPPSVLEAAFKTHADYQRKVLDSPEEINESNWNDHFGDERYYRAYVAALTKSVLELGIDATLEKYVFAPSANWVDGIKDDKKQPQMLNRLLSGVLHPFIHAGYGIEYNSPGMLVEGLAMACVARGPDLDALFPRSFFSSESLSSHLASALTLSSKPTGTHSFSIVAQMLKDPELAPGAACTAPTVRAIRREENADAPVGNPFPHSEILKKRGELIRKYADKWTVNTNDKVEVKDKLEELFVLMTLLYGVCGLQEGRDFKADFILMHLVTSSLFLPYFVDHISPSAQSILFRSYLATILSIWLARGRPAIPIESFYTRTTPSITPPGTMPTPNKETLTPDAPTPNAWLALLQSTLLHPNEHLPKAQRALAHFARVYGGRPAGFWEGTELEGAEKIDGTLFVRVAALTMGRLGWLREGEEKGEWDFSGFWA